MSLVTILMPTSKSLQISKATRYQNAAIDFYTGLTGTSYLHYGYWQPIPTSIDEVTIPRMRVAQEAYATKLLDLIPAGTKTILDVGCGIGGNAKTMIGRGFNVEGLAPDPLQQIKFVKYTEGKVPFHLTTFEDYRTDRQYDLVLFSESSQYISVDNIATGTAKLLESGGYLLMADMLRTDSDYNDGIFSNCHLKSDLTEAMGKAGFKLIQTEDISAEIAPTIDLSIEAFRTYGLSTIEYISALVEIAVPPIHALGRSAFKKWLSAPIAEGLSARLVYDRHLCYEIQLWQLL
jgi:MPBQ/MSBQ methyltransferase